SVVLNDGANVSNTATASIHVAAANDTPDLTPNAPSAVAYTENAAATALLSTAAITDPDNPASFVGGSYSVAITAGAAAGDQIVLLASAPFAVNGTSLLYAGDVIGSIAGLGSNSVSVTALTSFATSNVVNQLAKAFGFQNSSDDPAAPARTVTFTFNDGGNTGGGGLSDSVTQTVNVTAVNDAPVNTVPSAVLNANENGTLAIAGLSL